MAAVIARLPDRLRAAPHSGSIVTRSSSRHRRGRQRSTDVNPNNVFLSDVHGPAPVVKLGDLGNCESRTCAGER